MARKPLLSFRGRLELVELDPECIEAWLIRNFETILALPPAFTVLATPTGRPYGLAHGRGYLGGREHGACIRRSVRHREAGDSDGSYHENIEKRAREADD